MDEQLKELFKKAFNEGTMYEATLSKAYSFDSFIEDNIEQLRLYDVSITLPPDENIINAMKLLAEIDYKNDWVWGYDTDLGKPKDVIQAFKNELLGN